MICILLTEGSGIKPGTVHFVYDLTPPEGPSRLARAPEQIAALLAHVLESTDKPFRGYELPDVLSALESHRASADAINKVREQGVRLDIPHCL